MGTTVDERRVARRRAGGRGPRRHIGGARSGGVLGARVATVLVSLVLAVAGSALGPLAPAHAGAGDGISGELAFIPGGGDWTTPAYTVLPAPCPAKATHTVGAMTGPGLPAKGLSIVSNSPAGMRHDAPFGVPLTNSFINIATFDKVTFVAGGTYTITVRCSDALGAQTFATFAGTVTFTSATQWAAKKPQTPPAFGVPAGFIEMGYPELASAAGPSGATAPTPAGSPVAVGPAASAAGSVSSGAGSVASAGGADPGASSPAGGNAVAGAPASAAVPPADDGGPSLPVVLGLVALVLGLIYIVLKVNRRPRQQLGLPAKPAGKPRQRV